MSRRLYYNDFEVMRFKTWHRGEPLPIGQILVKLRSKDEQPFWTRLDRNTFLRERFFAAHPPKGTVDGSEQTNLA